MRRRTTTTEEAKQNRKREKKKKKKKKEKEITQPHSSEDIYIKKEMAQDRKLIGAVVQYCTASGWWHQNMLKSGAVLTAVLSKKPPFCNQSLTKLWQVKGE